MGSWILLFVLGVSHPTELEREIKLVRDAYFPTLQHLEIRLEEFQESDFFFATDVDYVLFPFRERRYVIQFNDQIFQDPPPRVALRAILAHELFHLKEYQTLTRWQLIKLGLRYWWDLEFRIRFERATDARAIEAGFADGLKEYRQWLYKRISPQALESRRKTYLTPEEIDFVKSGF